MLSTETSQRINLPASAQANRVDHTNAHTSWQRPEQPVDRLPVPVAFGHIAPRGTGPPGAPPDAVRSARGATTSVENHNNSACNSACELANKLAS